MRRIAILLTCAAMLAAATAALATGHRAKLKLGSTSVGKIVQNGGGFTVYMFTRDRRREDNCVKVSDCAAVWSPVTTSGRPQAGPGVKRALLGTIKLPSGVKQVTYAGHPLYTYTGDSGPGDTSYIGFSQFGGTWYALNASGHAVK
jgi:predicted lipoprotein with Yx(FWY)xxD motif